MYAPWSADVASALIAAHPASQDSLLPILHDFQARFGCVPPEAVGQIALALNLSRADVHGVVGFYPDFRSEPPGRVHLKLCQSEACQARGGRELTEWAQHRLGARLGETRADGAVTLDPVYCLGLCASGPAASMDERLAGRLTPAALDALCEGAGL